MNRYPPYAEEIRSADSVAYVYHLLEQSQKDNAVVMREALERMRMDYDEFTTPNGYPVVIPDETLTPDEVPTSAVPVP